MISRWMLIIVNKTGVFLTGYEHVEEWKTVVNSWFSSLMIIVNKA